MATLKVSSLGDYIREQRESAQVSLRQLAKVAGVSNPYLSQIERGMKKPSAEILQQIAKGLRISAETLYVRAGILDEHHGPGDVVAAVMSDPSIGERHKRVLLDIYQSFRAEHAADAPEKTSRSAGTTARKTAAKRTATDRKTKTGATKTRATQTRAVRSTAGNPAAGTTGTTSTTSRRKSS